MSHWWGFDVDEDGKRRVAVNLRLVDPAPVADVPIRHFDALDTWMGWPMDGGASGTCGPEVRAGVATPRPQPSPRRSLERLRFTGPGSHAPTPPGRGDAQVRIG